MKSWLQSLLACLDCGADLVVSDRTECKADDLITGTLCCEECSLAWPVLAGVPLMLSAPGAYLTSYRDSVLATLAENGLASVEAVGMIDEFSTGHISEPMRLRDDWTALEVSDSTGQETGNR